jgi:hypothetical protein
MRSVRNAHTEEFKTQKGNTMSKLTLRQQISILQDKLATERMSTAQQERVCAKLTRITKQYRDNLAKGRKPAKRIERRERRAIDDVMLIKEFFANKPRTAIEEQRTLRDKFKEGSAKWEMHHGRLQTMLKVYRYMIAQRAA